MTRVSQQQEQGSALVMALLLVLVVGALTRSLADGSRLLMRDTVTERGALQAFHAAEAGLELARWGVARDADYRGESVRVGRADVDVRIERLGGLHRGSEPEWRVVATARCWPRGEQGNAYRRRVEVRLRLVPGCRLPVLHAWRELR